MTSLTGTPLARRTFLAGGLLALTAGCSGGPPPSRPTATASTPPTTSVAPPPTTPPAPASPQVPDLPGYQVLGGEVEPACKQAAVDYVTAVLTTGTPSVALGTLEARLAALGQPTGPAGALQSLLPAGGASSLAVVYPQYGGLTAARSQASIMLVADQAVLAAVGSAVEQRSTTVDVRLAVTDGRWQVTEVLPAAPPPAAPGVTPAVQAVLDDPRVLLPAAARADLLAGGIVDPVATALTRLAQRWQVHVQVLTGGHPVNVFATDRVSNHTRGRAVDIWALDGIPVIDQARCPWQAAMEEGSAAGASEVGGPQSTGLPGGFTDQVHQDHLHLGFSRG